MGGITYEESSNSNTFYITLSYTPSPVRDAMEFSFTTFLVKDTVLVKDEVLPFSYNAELSPLTVGTDSLDLATVSVTVDWAD